MNETLRIKIKNLPQTKLGKTVRVKIESVAFEGLGGKVFAPTLLREYDARIYTGSLTVKLPDMDPDSVYHITVTPAKEKGETYENKNIPVRYEFERGTLLGTAYTYDSAYATTGETAGMVGGIEHPGDGVRLIFTVPKDGGYDIRLIYGKANDGPAPVDRVGALAELNIDGKTQTVTLPNTIRGEYTAAIDLTAWLDAGDHSIELTHGTGTFVLDSMLVKQSEKPGDLALLYEKEASGEDRAGYIAVAPENGWYEMETETEATVNGTSCPGRYIYLREGLNLIVLEGQGSRCTVRPAKQEYTLAEIAADEFSLSGGAGLQNGAVTGISSEGGSAAFTLNAPEAGDYRVTLTYSNNAEGGAHDYNVDLIEQYFTVTAAGTTQRVWCRNTYSDENRATVTFTVSLPAGESEIVFSNDGSVRFDGRGTEAPKLYGVTVNPAWAE